jgi:hypothetical protein
MLVSAAWFDAAEKGGFKIRVQKIVSNKAGRFGNAINIIDAYIPLSRFTLAQISLPNIGLCAQFPLAKAGVFSRRLHILSDDLAYAAFNRLVLSASHSAPCHV